MALACCVLVHEGIFNVKTCWITSVIIKTRNLKNKIVKKV